MVSLCGRAQDSWLRILDPRTRLAILTTLIVLTFTVSNLYGMLLLVVLTLTLCFTARVYRVASGLLKAVVPMLLAAFIMWSLFYNYSLFHTYRGSGIDFGIGLFMTLRLVVLILAPLAFIAVTTPSELIAALESLRLPGQLVFLLGLTLRHVSSIADEYRAIKEAQTARGLDLDKGSLPERIRKYVPVLIPLLVRSIEVANRVALAMELKQYRPGRRSTYYKRRLRAVDYAVLAFLAVTLLAVLWIGFSTGGVLTWGL